jgi:hypothetical protein
MPNYRRWNGGTTAVSQVKTIRFTTSAATNVVTVTMTGEDGSTQTVAHTVADTVNNTTAAAVQAACAASSNSLFNQVAFTVSTDTVTVTAGVAGRPFYLAVTDDGSTAYTVANPTANAGPNDWNTAANWSGSAVPVGDDLVAFSNGSNDVLYGLDQSGIDLRQFSVTEGFRGNIGTSNAPLKIDTDRSDDAGSESLELGGSGYYYNFQGDYPIVNVTKNSGTLKIKGGLTKTSFTGTAVSGNITLDSSTATTPGNAITVVDVSPACFITIPSTATNTGDIVQNSGRIDLFAVTKSAKSSLLLGGNGRFTTKDSGVINTNSASTTAISVVGGTYTHESDADFTGGGTHLALYGGKVDMTKVRAATGAEFVDMGPTEVYGGELDLSASGSLATSTLTGYGGTIKRAASTLSTSKL